MDDEINNATLRLIALGASSPHAVYDVAGTRWDWTHYVIKEVTDCVDTIMAHSNTDDVTMQKEGE